jgi:hypothetical protein
MTAIRCPMLCVIAVMTGLAQGSQILRIVMTGIMIQVCYGQNHTISTIAWRSLDHQGVVFYPAELTPVLRPLQYFIPDLFPVLRVEMSQFRLYRHFL